MSTLDNLEPKQVFHFFREMAAIPHGSGDTKAISDYCVKFARDRGLFVKQDELGNIIIRRDATSGYENVDGVILQGHLDMVCEKTRDCTIDFEKDGLNLQTDGSYIWADGTTLGGDDGIAGAYGLALLDATDIPHPELEVILTVDEEIGLLGAAGIDLSEVKGRKLINVDSEEEGIFLTSCAGGLSLACTIPLLYEKREGSVYEIELTGLKGGHSGTEIDKGRANSNMVMGRILDTIQQDIGCEIANMSGGTKDNAIPRDTSGRILVQEKDEEKLQQITVDLQKVLREEFAGTDDGLTITVKKTEDRQADVLTKESKKVALNALMNMPNGIESMSADVEGLVETSLNMGIMTLQKTSDQAGNLFLRFAVRSSKETARDYLTRRTIAMTEQMNGSCSIDGAYPGWAYKRESSLRDTFVKAYEKIYGETPICQGIHAGVECGMFTGKVPDMDCISLGPNMEHVHTAEERLDVASTERTWKLLLEVLAQK